MALTVGYLRLGLVRSMIAILLIRLVDEGNLASEAFDLLAQNFQVVHVRRISHPEAIRSCSC